MKKTESVNKISANLNINVASVSLVLEFGGVLLDGLTESWEVDVKKNANLYTSVFTKAPQTCCPGFLPCKPRTNAPGSVNGLSIFPWCLAEG